MVYHVLSCAVVGLPLFRRPANEEAFQRIMVEAHQRNPVRMLTQCLIRTHRRFVVWRRKDG